jgi:hypothetical protein
MELGRRARNSELPQAASSLDHWPLDVDYSLSCWPDLEVYLALLRKKNPNPPPHCDNHYAYLVILISTSSSSSSLAISFSCTRTRYVQDTTLVYNVTVAFNTFALSSALDRPVRERLRLEQIKQEHCPNDFRAVQMCISPSEWR